MTSRRTLALDIVTDNAAGELTTQDRFTIAGLVDELQNRKISRKTFLRQSVIFGLSATSLSAILAACGSSVPSSSAASTGTPVPAPSTGGASLAPASPDLTKKLNLGIEGDADTVDPQAFKTIPGYYMLANLYDQLIDLHAEPQNGLLIADPANPTSMIAESSTISPDLLTATFKLDPNAKFEDGTPITVDDIKYSFQRGIEGTQYTNTLMKMLTLSSANNILTPDPQTVIFKLDKPNPMTQRLLSLQVLSIQSKARSEANATAKDKFADAYWRANVYANSAYKLLSWKRGEGFELAPNTNYYRAGLPKNGGLVFREIADPQERISLLKSGDLHAAFQIAPKDAAALRDGSDTSVKLVTAPSTWNWALTFTNSMKPFDNKQVRQAISYAIPYDTIISDVMHGLARPSKGLIVPGMPTSDQSFWNYNTDLAKAKQLLTAAGYPDGFESSIDVVIGRAEDEQMAVFIQANLQQIGVTVTINKLAEAQYQDNRNNAKSPMQVIEWFSWVNDPFYHMYWNLLSTNTFTNSARYSNPEVDKLIMAGLYEADAAKRESISKDVQKIVVDDAPWAFLFARDFFVPVAKNLYDFPLWPDQNPRLYWAYVTA
jgi:peptide/nickel transport system substrate-binding protein